MPKLKKILITGIAGSGGSYLAEYLLNNEKNVKISGIARWHSTTNLENLTKIIDKINIVESDMNDFASLFSVISKVKPDIIFHLAAHANVKASFATPGNVFSNNTLSTLNLLESVRLSCLNPIIQICSTSEVYGLVKKEEVPINENNPLRPVSPYAVSKVAADLLGFSYFKNYSMKIIRTRMFSYLNPRRTDLFATSFAKQVAWVELGLKKEVVHGNLNSIRTIIDVFDAMKAYSLAVKYCKYGEVYNIGGVNTISVGDFLKKLINFSNKKIPTRLDKKLLRPTDVTLQIPDTTKFYKITKWKPQIKLEDSILNLLNFWREEAKIEKIKLSI